MGTIVYPIGSDEARPALGDVPRDGAAGDGEGEADDEALASAIECVAPPWTNRSAYYVTPRGEADEDRCVDSAQGANGRGSSVPRDECELEEPRSVCVRVTLNDDPHQHSNESDCVRYVYYDE